MAEAEKNYLEAENARNLKNHALYSAMLKRAFGNECQVMIAHHLTFEGEGVAPDEIPSADTFLFDIALMRRIFGLGASNLLQQMAILPPEQRDALLASAFYGIGRTADASR